MTSVAAQLPVGVAQLFNEEPGLAAVAGWTTNPIGSELVELFGIDAGMLAPETGWKVMPAVVLGDGHDVPSGHLTVLDVELNRL